MILLKSTDKFKEIKGAMKRRVFNLAELSGKDNSGEDKMIVKLKKKFM
jgi:hypothetical protein